jgi:ATP-dependent DNA helicase 2 subunit 1
VRLSLLYSLYLSFTDKNVALQWHYRILQALALDEDHPGEPEDKTKPKYRQIDKVSAPEGELYPSNSLILIDIQRAGDYVLAWSDQLDAAFDTIFGGTAATKSTLVKRGPKDSADSEGGPAAKRMKTEGGAGGVDEEVKRCYDKGTVSKLTLPVLKEFLTAHGRSAAGKKADLVDRVEQFFENM